MKCTLKVGNNFSGTLFLFFSSFYILIIQTEKMTVEEVKTIVFRYVMVYYNRKRIMTVNPGGLPPSIYRERFETQFSVA